MARCLHGGIPTSDHAWGPQPPRTTHTTHITNGVQGAEQRIDAANRKFDELLDRAIEGDGAGWDDFDALEASEGGWVGGVFCGRPGYPALVKGVPIHCCDWLPSGPLAWSKAATGAPFRTAADAAEEETPPSFSKIDFSLPESEVHRRFPKFPVRGA